MMPEADRAVFPHFAYCNFFDNVVLVENCFRWTFISAGDGGWPSIRLGFTIFCHDKLPPKLVFLGEESPSPVFWVECFCADI